MILKFNDFINEDSKEDKEHAKKINDEAEDDADKCPRCDEVIEDCTCETDDHWSTRTLNRIPSKNVIKNKSKQEFKKE